MIRPIDAVGHSISLISERIVFTCCTASTAVSCWELQLRLSVSPFLREFSIAVGCPCKVWLRRYLEHAIFAGLRRVVQFLTRLGCQPVVFRERNTKKNTRSNASRGLGQFLATLQNCAPSYRPVSQTLYERPDAIQSVRTNDKRNAPGNGKPHSKFFEKISP